MSPQKDTQKAGGLTEELRAAMKERGRELKAEARRGSTVRKGKAKGESAVPATFAEMPEPDRTLAECMRAIVKANVADRAPKTWYGMPSYAWDGKVVCAYQSAAKLNARYKTLGFSDLANLDNSAMWPTTFALQEITAAEETRIVALVKTAMS